MDVTGVILRGSLVVVSGLAAMAWWQRNDPVLPIHPLSGVEGHGTTVIERNGERYEVCKELWDGQTYGNPFPDTWDAKLAPLRDLWSFMFRHGWVDIPDQDKLDEMIPVVQVDQHALENPPADEVQLTWLGHASFLVQMNGLSVLTDPVFEERCSPSQWAGPKRYRPAPAEVEELGRVDVVLLSHNHYDHTCVTTLQRVASENPECVFYCPLGLGELLRSEVGVAAEKVVELGWWDEAEVTKDVRVACTPAQHASRRGVGDAMATLWSSWMIMGRDESKEGEGEEVREVRVWFGGDTGYCKAFKEIREVYGRVDVALVPIGAGETPKKFLCAQHVDAREAAKVCSELEARYAVGCHWGTWVLTGEAIDSPKAKFLDEASSVYGRGEEEWGVMAHGETRQYVVGRRAEEEE